jgi:hypothetical protein
MSLDIDPTFAHHVRERDRIASGGTEFQAVVGAIKRATVYLHSQGGDVRGAIQLGWAIRAKHFQTAIMDHGVCVSACGLVLARGREALHRLEWRRRLPRAIRQEADHALRQPRHDGVAQGAQRS